HNCPGCVARLLAPLQDAGFDVRLDAKEEGQLAADIALLADQEAAVSGKTRNQVVEEAAAVFRARRIHSWPRFDINAIMESEFGQQSMRFADRMFKLFRRFVTAYVSAAAEDIQSEAAAKSKQASAEAGISPGAPTATAAASAATPLPTTASQPESKVLSTITVTTTATRPSPTSRRSKTHTRSTSTHAAAADHNDGDEDGDDEEDEDDNDGGKDSSKRHSTRHAAE
ncbi:hypothetical protein H4R19_000916, partial [Coemansia spiralis]